MQFCKGIFDNGPINVDCHVYKITELYKTDFITLCNTTSARHFFTCPSFCGLFNCVEMQSGNQLFFKQELIQSCRYFFCRQNRTSAVPKTDFINTQSGILQKHISVCAFLGQSQRKNSTVLFGKKSDFLTPLGPLGARPYRFGQKQCPNRLCDYDSFHVLN